ncbi:MAG: hypothetical protein ACOYUK_03480 [Patescibacteria group bacterium]
MTHHLPRQSQSGISLVEILVAGGIFAIIIVILVGSYITSQDAALTAGARERAVQLADEGLEASRTIRDADFGIFTDGTYGLQLVGDNWQFAGSSDRTDDFTRTITIRSLDAQTREITSRVTWPQSGGRTGTISLVTYLTDWHQVQSLASWTNPTVEASLNLAGNADAVKVQISGSYAYMVRPSGTPNFMVIDISDPTSPQVAGSLNLATGGNDITLAGQYAYVASSDNNAELQIVDISTPSAPVTVRSYNAAGVANALGVTVAGSTVYLVRASSTSDEFFAIDVSTPASPHLQDSMNLGSQANDVIVLGTYAYVASANNAQELTVINVANPAVITQVASYNASGTADGLSVAGFGNTIVLGTAGNAVETIDIATPLTPKPLGIYNASGAVYDMALGAGNQYVFLATGQTSADFKVADISDLENIVEVSTLDVNGPLRGVAYSSTLDRAVLAGTQNSNECIIIMPQ